MKKTDARYYDIDAARTFVMFVAVFIHSSNVYSPHDLSRTTNTERYFFFEWFSLGLHLFISPTFFIVGGFFTIFLLKKYGLKKFIVKRFSRVLLPIGFAAVSVVFIEQYLRYRDAIGNDENLLSAYDFLFSEAFSNVIGDGYWLHIWFLVQLVLSFAASVIAVLLLDRIPIVKEILLSFMDKIAKLFTIGPVPTVTLIVGLAGVHFVLMGATSLLPNPYTAIKIGPLVDRV